MTAECLNAEMLPLNNFCTFMNGSLSGTVVKRHDPFKQIGKAKI